MLSSLHHEFLRHCEVEKRLAAQTVTAYRSDFLGVSFGRH